MLKSGVRGTAALSVSAAVLAICRNADSGDLPTDPGPLALHHCLEGPLGRLCPRHHRRRCRRALQEPEYSRRLMYAPLAQATAQADQLATQKRSEATSQTMLLSPTSRYWSTLQYKGDLAVQRRVIRPAATFAN